MFSLVITVIAIALVAVLALATIYFGGGAFNTGQESAKVAQFQVEGQQIGGAAVLFSTTTAATQLTDLQQLVDSKYLSAIPTGWTVVDGAIAQENLTSSQCLAANKRLGISTVPTCGDPAYAGTELCCTVAQ